MSELSKPQIIVVGCSSGGFNALKMLLGGLAARLPQSVLVCSHTTGDVDTLCDLLGAYSTLPVKPAREREAALGGTVYLAPSGYHLLLENHRHFALSVDRPEHFSRPSIDVLFESVADACQQRAIGLILTGANSDGAKGLARLRACGGIAIVQSPDSAEAPVMPQAALDIAGADFCLPLLEIPPLLNHLCLS